MRTDGELRKVIKDLAQAGGAYIIVSSQGSLADSALIDRRNAMKEQAVWRHGVKISESSFRGVVAVCQSDSGRQDSKPHRMK